jgi:biotin carboxyl carrier protein
MTTFRTVDSSSAGIVEKVLINVGAYVYEWEPLFLIKTQNGLTKKIELGASGIVSQVNVAQGDQVCSAMTLAILQEDALPTGSD